MEAKISGDEEGRLDSQYMYSYCSIKPLDKYYEPLLKGNIMVFFTSTLQKEPGQSPELYINRGGTNL
jgi:hypothetical protein